MRLSFAIIVYIILFSVVTCFGLGTPPSAKEMSYFGWKNLLANPSFELGRTGTSGSNISINSTPANVFSSDGGRFSLAWDPTGSDEITLGSIPLKSGSAGAILAKCNFQAVDQDYVFVISDGSNDLATETIKTDGTGSLFAPVILKTYYTGASDATWSIRLRSPDNNDVIYVDVCSFGYEEYPTVFVPFSSDLEPYGPVTWSNITTSSDNFQKSRNGQFLNIIGTFVKSGGSAAEMRFALPTGLVVGGAGKQLVGSGGVGVVYAGTMNIYGNAGDTYLTFAAQDSSNVGTVNTNGSFWADGTYSIRVSVPIQGWTTGFPTAASVGQNLPVEFRAIKNGGSGTANNAISSWTSKSDPRGIFNLSTGEAVIPDNGWYDVKGSLCANGSVSTYAQIYSGANLIIAGSDASSVIKNVSDSVYLTKGTVLTLRPSGNITLGSFDTCNVFSISKINTPQSLMNIRKVAYIKDVKALNTAPQSLSATTWNKRDLNTLNDPYGIITSLSSDVFVLQPGRYRIRALCPHFAAANVKCRVRNTTAGATVAESHGMTTNSNTIILSTAEDLFSITAASNFEVQHYVNSVVNGGQAMNFGDSEKYTTVEIEKLD